MGRGYRFLMSKLRYRKHIRLKGYDYSDPGYYFVTVCTKGWEKLFAVRVSEKFGSLLDRSVAATHASPIQHRNTDVAEKCLMEIPEHYAGCKIDFYVFMENHLHFILVIGGACPAATGDGKVFTLGNIVGSFKSAVSRLLGQRVWQPSYYEHVIRNEHALHKIRKYILNNPRVEHEAIGWGKLDR